MRLATFFAAVLFPFLSFFHLPQLHSSSSSSSSSSYSCSQSPFILAHFSAATAALTLALPLPTAATACTFSFSLFPFVCIPRFWPFVAAVAPMVRLTLFCAVIVILIVMLTECLNILSPPFLSRHYYPYGLSAKLLVRKPSKKRSFCFL